MTDSSEYANHLVMHHYRTYEVLKVNPATLWDAIPMTALDGLKYTLLIYDPRHHAPAMVQETLHQILQALPDDYDGIKRRLLRHRDRV